MPNPFVHLELNAPDLTKAQSFYGQMFDWQFHDMDMGPNGIYSTFATDKGPTGGMVSMPGRPPARLAYIGVEDIDESTAKARSLGATITMDVTEIPGIGWMTLMLDPTGASCRAGRRGM